MSKTQVSGPCLRAETAVDAKNMKIMMLMLTWEEMLTKMMMMIDMTDIMTTHWEET